MFKNGSGLLTLFDRDYGVERTFHLHDERDLLTILQRHDLKLVEIESEDRLGGMMYFTDPKQARHCVFFARKAGSAATTRGTTTNE